MTAPAQRRVHRVSRLSQVERLALGCELVDRRVRLRTRHRVTAAEGVVAGVALGCGGLQSDVLLLANRLSRHIGAYTFGSIVSIEVVE